MRSRVAGRIPPERSRAPSRGAAQDRVAAQAARSMRRSHARRRFAGPDDHDLINAVELYCRNKRLSVTEQAEARVPQAATPAARPRSRPTRLFRRRRSCLGKVLRIELGEIDPAARFLLEELDAHFEALEPPREERRRFGRGGGRRRSRHGGIAELALERGKRKRGSLPRLARAIRPSFSPKSITRSGPLSSRPARIASRFSSLQYSGLRTLMRSPRSTNPTCRPTVRIHDFQSASKIGSSAIASIPCW
jgi:hypothetical protein